MAEENGIHPGSWIGDTVEEFKKLPTGGKIVVGIIVVGVIGFAIYSYNKSKATTTAQTSPVASSLSAFPSTTPQLPATTYGADTTGSTPTITIPSTPGMTTTPTSTVPTPAPITTTPSTTTSPATTPPVVSNAAKTYTVQSGDTLSSIGARNNESWQQLFSTNQQLITQTAAAHNNPVPGGPQNNIFPGEQLKIGTPGKSLWYTVRQGDNMNNVAHQLGLPSWKSFGVDSFYPGQKVSYTK